MVAAGSITVAVRVRPPTSWEAARLPEPCYDTTIRGDGALSTPIRAVTSTCSLRDIVQIVDDRILTFDPDEKDRAKAFVERGFMPPGAKRYKDKRFMFDKVFDNEARQQDVFESTSKPLLNGLFEGYNATVFAYGATGCGKTHTISGTASDPGIIYLTMADLFQRIEDRKDEWNVEVMVTFLEIYNEEIRDLLAEPGTPHPRGGLAIREDKAVKVAGLTELKPISAEEVKSIVLQGNLRRTQSPTLANETSSRSHAVLQVHVTQSPRTASVTEERTMATLSIIDLAGSERAAATTNMGQRMVEGANINKSLLALGNCINALCESGGAIRHVPYRNSKLTRLLKFSLGGNCKTVMIVCVAPTSNHFDDTHNTLVYAERATKIKTKVVTRNVVNVDRHVGRYVEAITRLNAEISELKAKLAGKNTSESEIVKRRRKEASAEIERAKNDMKAKVDQTKASIIDGSACAGKLYVANARLDAVRARLAQIDAAGAPGSLSSDLEAERALLKALAGPEESAVRSDSTLTVRLQRSSNSTAMFDATIRAVSERRSDKLDEFGIENVKLDAKCRKAEIEALKAQGECDVLKTAVDDMADVIVKLVGMLGRCTVMIGDAGNVLNTSATPAEENVTHVAELLSTVKQKNDAAFMELVGHSTEGYTLHSPLPGTSSLDNLKGYGTSFTHRISSASGVLQASNTSKSTTHSRRSSLYNNSLSVSETPRRQHKSPRKSLRSSMATLPYRRAPEKEKKSALKNVQWKDQAGRGSLDDAGSQSRLVAAPSPVPSEPSSSHPGPGPSINASGSMLPRNSSLGGSESEWEDENDRTDDSMSLSFLSAPRATIPKRPRASRLDPSFLKSKTRASTLGSLVEDDEGTASPDRRGNPLTDMNFNHVQSSDDSGTPRKALPRLSMHGSPGRRGTLGRLGSGSGVGQSKSGRRRSNVGPMRNEKGRRRSSLIPQLSSPNSDGNKSTARRVLLTSPSKRSKRSSMAGNRSAGSSKTRSIPASLANLSVIDPNGSADISFGNKSFRPTWR